MPTHRHFLFVTLFCHLGCLLLISLSLQADINLPPPPAGGAIEVITDPLPIFDPSLGRGMPRDPVATDVFDPLNVLLSRSRYWQEDGHLECIIRLSPPEGVETGETRLSVRLLDADGHAVAATTYSNLPATQFIIYPHFPTDFSGTASAEFLWKKGDRPLGEVSAGFRVERRHPDGIRHGAVPLKIANPDRIRAGGIPMSVGVPFPRGALDSIDNLRLVDAAGVSIEAQFTERARWSRFGSVKWILCDFTINLDGEPMELLLEFGPSVKSPAVTPMFVEPQPGGGFPLVDAGTLRFDGGLWLTDADGNDAVKILAAAALTGAYVEHENGAVFHMAVDGDFEVEEQGPEKTVIKTAGWYRDENDREFCQYVVRYVIYRDSPLLRIFHTWIFTGDSNRDRIAAMGWRFPLPGPTEAAGFLDSFGPDGIWLKGDRLLQYDYEHYAVQRGGDVMEFAGGRAPGVIRAKTGDAILYLGSKDFWQNYPSELEIGDDWISFNNWPRRNRPRRGMFDGKTLSTERGQPAALPSAARYGNEAEDVLTQSEWKLNVVQARFAHEGEVLDFQLPPQFGEEPIWKPRGGVGWPQSDAGAVNAQGISRTEEMWVYLQPQPPARVDVSASSDSRMVLAALNEERLRCYPDPAWIAASGAFYELHPYDPERFPVEERAYEQLALATQRWVEQLGYYGMWLYGDLAAWSAVPLETRTPWLYRALRKAHHGWPYSWMPYIRSGDPRMLKFAEAALRQLIDASYVHYVSDEVRRQDRDGFQRRKGLQNVGPIAWAGAAVPMTRHMHTKVDSHLAAWYLTNYHRAMDNFLCWAEQTKVGGIMGMTDPNGNPLFPGSGRGTVALIRAYIEAYEATFDPWFLVAAHGMAESHMRQYRSGQWNGHFYATGDREFHRFTGDNGFKEYYLHHASKWADLSPGSWARMGAPKMHINAYAWEITGDDYYRRRAAHAVDWLPATVYDGDKPNYLVGTITSGNPPAYTGWALEHYPRALAAVAAQQDAPEPVHNAMQVPGHNLEVAVLKEAGEPLTLNMAAGTRPYSRDNTFQLTGPDGDVIQSGVWQADQSLAIDIPAASPAGVYRWRLTDLPASYAGFGVEIPLSPLDTPEVLMIEPGVPLSAFHHRNQMWFKVPQHLEQFTLSVPVGSTPRRASIWNPRGERVWDLNHHPGSHDGGRNIEATIPVAAEDRGKLWRVTFPGGEPVILDPLIPRIFAIERNRWFDPADNQ